MREGQENFRARLQRASTIVLFAGGAFLLLLITVFVWTFAMLVGAWLIVVVAGFIASALELVKLAPSLAPARIFAATLVGFTLIATARALFPPAPVSLRPSPPSTDAGVLDSVAEVARALCRQGIPVMAFDVVRAPLGPTVYTASCGGVRELSLGRAVVALLDEAELRSIIAHEYAHHERHRMLALRLAWHICGSLNELYELARKPRRVTSAWSLASSWFSPYRWLPHRLRRRFILKLCNEVLPRLSGSRVQLVAVEFLIELWGRGLTRLTAPLESLSHRLTMILGHRIEAECDAVAAQVSGPEVYGRALTKVTLISTAWELYATHWIDEDRIELEAFCAFVESGVLAEFRPHLSAAWQRASYWHPSGHARLLQIGVSNPDIDPLVSWQVNPARASSSSPDLYTHARITAWHLGLRRRALALISSERELFELDMPARDVLLAVSVIMLFIPWPARFRCYLRGIPSVDRLSGTVLVCLSRMMKRGLLGAYTTTARQKQLLLCPPHLRPRLALAILLGSWSTIPKSSVFLRAAEDALIELPCGLTSKPVELASITEMLDAFECQRELLAGYPATQCQAEEQQHQ